MIFPIHQAQSSLIYIPLLSLLFLLVFDLIYSDLNYFDYYMASQNAPYNHTKEEYINYVNYMSSQMNQSPDV